jgi:hypothetical protein
MAGIGPAPKPASKRRRANKPTSYGLATPTTAPAAPDVVRTLGIDNPHPLIASMWEALQTSCESRFYSAADWERARWELWYADQTMRKPTGSAWQQVQHGLTELLVSPAAKRRAAIELKAAGPDADENAAVAMIGRYRQQLKPV